MAARFRFASRMPRPTRMPRMTRRRLVVGAVVLALLAGVSVWAAWPAGRDYTAHAAMLTVRTGPDGDVPVTLDTTFYLPRSASARHPVPAVLLAHGFGGTKDSVADQAGALAARGYAVLTWTAEGFGRSGGQIHLDSPDWEVRDARRLLDWLAARPQVRTDAPGDPRVAVVGGSYGGALALLLAGYDHRVDALVPQITWHDLADAFLPEATGAGPAHGVFKKAWAGLFFGDSAGVPARGPAPALTGVGPGVTATPGVATGPAPRASAGALPDPSAASPPHSGASPAGDGSGVAGPAASCGRFATDVCAAYLSIAATGRATAGQLALLRRSSPASVDGRIRAPTLLVQGQADSLFPLAEADANAAAIAASGTPVRVVWYTGGHDGGPGPVSDQDRIESLTDRWLDYYLRGIGPVPPDTFVYSRVTGIDAAAGGVVARGYSASRYPGLSGTSGTRVEVSGPARPVANPPNGTPAALSALPGAGGVPGAALTGVTGGATEVPGQHADFLSAPLRSAVDVVGAPTVRVRAASPTGEAVLFVKLYDVDPRGTATLPDGLVAPVRLTGLPTTIDAARPVTVTLPAIVHRFPAGHRLRITVATADRAYLTPADPAVYTVAVDGTVRLPTVVATPLGNPDTVWRWVLAGLAAAIVVGVAGAIWWGRRRSRRAGHAVDPHNADVPLVVRELRKEYPGGFVAVSRVDFTVHRGQVVGLLGPNGAGKTTSLRVLLGLTRPSAGQIQVFGHPLVPGAPVLSRIGALVEAPGFLPHLSGRANLTLYWRATGRPAVDSHVDEALAIAGLGTAVDRKVKTYSHGMRQRLAIAQAMLGLPDLLVLDEPTDGLDPPQIAQMRQVLRGYATAGRAVLVSSHLLAEVEQTCTHVVVVNKGTVVAAGPVDEVVGESPSVQFAVSDPGLAAEVLIRCGARSVVPEGGGLVADLDGAPRAEAVAALVSAGIEVDRVVPRRRLEDAFLALVGEDTSGGGER